MINFANGLSRAGIRVDLLAGAADGPFRSLVASGVHTIALNRGMVKSMPAIRKYLRQTQPDILFASQLHVNLVAIASRFWNSTRSRVVIREATTPSESIKYQASAKQKRMTQLARHFFRRADHLIAVSQDSASDCIEFYRLDPDRVSTVYAPFVNSELYQLAAEPVSHPWFDQGQRVIVSMGRVMPVKDFATLVDAFAIAKSRIDCRLMIIGDTDRDPECFAAVQQRVAHHGLEQDVEFIGFRKNPFPYLAHAEVYALSSRFEGMPGSLVQGMAMGCKLVSTNCRSGPREVLEDGNRGILVPVGDAQALGQALVASLNQSHDRSLGRRWSEKFTEEYAIQSLIDVFQQVIATK